MGRTNAIHVQGSFFLTEKRGKGHWNRGLAFFVFTIIINITLFHTLACSLFFSYLGDNTSRAWDRSTDRSHNTCIDQEDHSGLRLKKVPFHPFPFFFFSFESILHLDVSGPHGVEGCVCCALLFI